MSIKIFLQINVSIFLIMKAVIGNAQSPDNIPNSEELYNKIVYLDSSLFATVYLCNPLKNIEFFSEDFEFYHDKVGLIKSRKTFMEAMEKRFCGEQNGYKLRRELVAGSMKVYTLNNYGAVQTGEHRFYETTKYQKEKLTEIAKFTHIWQYKDGQWRISRAISYDHQN